MKIEDILQSDVIYIQWTPERLKKMRETLGLSQKQIADLIGVSSKSICHIERGRVTSRMILQGYGSMLERIYAKQCGYVPAYRKIGTTEFKKDI